MNTTKEGELFDHGSGRYCNEHGSHGALYVCTSYTKLLQEQVKAVGQKFREQCASGEVVFKITTRTESGKTTTIKNWNDMLKEQEHNK